VAPVALVLGYGVARSTAAFCQEARSAVFRCTHMHMHITQYIHPNTLSHALLSP